MTSRRTTPARAGAVRVPVAVGEIVGFTALAHVAGGGAAPGTGHLAVVAAVVTLLAVALRHQLVRPYAAVAGTVAAQIGLHAAFTHAAPPAMHDAHSTLPVSGDMLLAHVAAAVVTALALTWQEQIVVRLAARLLPDFAVTPIVRPARVGASAVPLPLRASLRSATVAPRRGPPVPA